MLNSKLKSKFYLDKYTTILLVLFSLINGNTALTANIHFFVPKIKIEQATDKAPADKRGKPKKRGENDEKKNPPTTPVKPSNSYKFFPPNNKVL